MALSPHHHTGKRIAHQETSYGSLGFLLLIVGVLLAGITGKTWADNVSVQAVVLGPKPTTAPAITVPANGQHFTTSPITVRGTCTPGLLVNVYKNDVLMGAALCDASGRFGLTGDLFIGRNDLVARMYDQANQPSPDSSTVTVFYDLASSPSLAGGTQNAGSKGNIVLTTESIYKGTVPGKELSWQVSIEGGVSPYAINIDWGDGQTELMSIPTAEQFTMQHVYDKAGGYKGGYVITKTQPVASIEIPLDQLNKLSSNTINVTTDRAISFNTPVSVKRDLNVDGQTTLHDVKITGTLALPTQAGQSISQTVAQSLSVVGISLLQGDVTAKGSIAVGSNLNVSGNGAFGGALSATQLNVKSANLGNTTISHLLTSGATPTATIGLGAGSGTVSIAGNDTAGTITVTTGNGAHASGDLVTVTFRTPFGSTPHVQVTPLGIDTATNISDGDGAGHAGQVYMSRGVNQFTIGVSRLKLGVAGVSYSFDYLVTQ